MNEIKAVIIMAMLERFDAMVVPEPNTGCHLWTGSSGGGYGRFSVKGVMQMAHRWNWETRTGRTAEGLDLDHKCRQPLCVNPAHLEPVTHRENCRRGRVGHNMRSRTHCPKGHEYTPGNTSRCFSGGVTRRSCRICNRLKAQLYRNRIKQALNQ